MSLQSEIYALETQGISKHFGAIKANDNINLRIRKGTIHCIIGENGAGKSTLMRIFTNIYKQDSGEVFVNGKKRELSKPLDAVKEGIGMVYQEFMLAENLTVFENVIAGYEKGKGPFIDFHNSRELVEEICNSYNLPLPLDEKVAELAVATKQQVEIVKVLYRGANIIIMDEPTATLTPQGIIGLFDAMRFLKSSGKTVVFITHKLDEVLEIADEISVLRDGKLIGIYSPQEVDKQKLANLMVGRSVILEANKQIVEKSNIEILKLKNVKVKDSNGIERVKGVDLKVHKGEIVGIAGVAGSGQKSLVEAIFGLVKSEKGSIIELEGKDITESNPLLNRTNGVSYVSQDRLGVGCNIKSNVWENIIMGYHRVRGFSPPWLLKRKDAMQYAGQIVNAFDVRTQSLETKVGNLSGGNIQKLIVGREFSLGETLLIVEDPTRGIDVGAIEYIWSKILEFSTKGISVLLISHELNEVMQLSDTIYVMFDGQLLYAGKHGQLTDVEIGILMTGGDLPDDIKEKLNA